MDSGSVRIEDKAFNSTNPKNSFVYRRRRQASNDNNGKEKGFEGKRLHFTAL